MAPLKITLEVDIDDETLKLLRAHETTAQKLGKLQLHDVRVDTIVPVVRRSSNKTFLNGNKKGIHQVYLQNLFRPPHQTADQAESQLKRRLSTYGTVRKLYVHPVKPFGFVTYVDEQGVDKLMRRDHSDVVYFHSSTVQTRRCLSKSQEKSFEFVSAPSCWLKVSRVGAPDKAAISSYFADYGDVKQTKIREVVATKETYALIEFAHHDSVTKALLVGSHSVHGTSGQLYKVTKSAKPVSSKGHQEIFASTTTITRNPNHKRARDTSHVVPPLKRVKAERESILIKEEYIAP